MTESGKGNPGSKTVQKCQRPVSGVLGQEPTVSKYTGYSPTKQWFHKTLSFLKQDEKSVM